MKVSKAKELFYQLTEGFFQDYAVVFTNQSRMAKSSVPLVVITPGNVRRPQAANTQEEDGQIVGYYLSIMTITVDLFTNGKAIKDDDGGTIAYSNTAMDEILSFADYLNSPKTVAWCNKNDVSILIESDAQDLTGIVNDNNYEYRSRIEVLFSFTQEVKGEISDMSYISHTAVNQI